MENTHEVALHGMKMRLCKKLSLKLIMLISGMEKFHFAASVSSKSIASISSDPLKHFEYSTQILWESKIETFVFKDNAGKLKKICFSMLKGYHCNVAYFV